MVTVNGKACHWEPGWTVRSILDYKRYSYPKIIVTVNGEHLEPEAFSIVAVNEGDVVQVIHLMAGG